MSAEDFKQQFDGLDKDKSGYLTEKEMSKMLGNRGYKVDEFKAMFRSFDDDSDGKISKDEFVSTMLMFDEDIHTKAAARKIFLLYDHDHSGSLERGEMTKVLRDLEDELSEKAFKKIQELLKNSDSRSINYEEFICALSD